METLHIIASREEYRIYDNDEESVLASGIQSYKQAISIQERLLRLKDAVARFAAC
ncbi:MAG: hypothetical protein HQL57_06135 [Magnetococcales bacterium]|nr:hypothetical protein [Magnetococcales bacterium]MBF0156747.1 hypothetical protein [Magnetococcales bacterium]